MTVLSYEDLDGGTRDVLAGLLREPWGQSSPSVYETGRLVSLSPWLPAHTERVRYLLNDQRPDGGWGPPDLYALVPTLSATEAVLATLGDIDAGRQPGIPGVDLAGAADRGLRSLFGLLTHPGSLSVPDTPAVDLIVPALVERINGHLDRLRHASVNSLPGERRLCLPDGMDATRLMAVRKRFGDGATVPQKLLHALEVLGDAARDAQGVRLAGPGAVGASPAATAAWLGGPHHADGEARAYLDAVARRHGGAVPCAMPITVFERAWVFSGLLRSGVPLAALDGCAVGPMTAMVESLTADWGPAGTPAGPGLPADADTTAVVLFTLAQFGKPADPQALLPYDTGDHFCTWPGEDGYSVSTNAHVLDAFGQHVTIAADPAPHYVAVVDRLSAWLCEQQQPDGAWRDRWHSSPYYATACCVLALAEFGRGPAAAEAVSRAVDWVVATQSADGSWGRWAGTVEETAYALHALLVPGGPAGTRVDEAVRRGHRYLLDAAGQQPDPPLWHDKDLYTPHAIVRATTLGALQLIQRRPAVPRSGISVADRR